MMQINHYYWILHDDGEEKEWKIIYIDAKMVEKLATLPYFKDIRGPILLEHYSD